MTKPSVLIIGLGGIGSVAAITLELNGKFEVSVIVRHQDEEFKKNGFKIDSIDFGKTYYKPRHAYTSVEECKDIHFDYVVVCTKNLPDSRTPCEELIAPAIKPGTCIFLIQNGLGIELPILEKFPNNLVCSGTSLTGVWRYGNNVTHIKPDDVTFGIFKANNVPHEEALTIFNRFVDGYRRHNNKISVENDVELSRWYKLCYNAVYNTTCAIANMDVTRCHIAIGLDSMFRKIMHEIIAIAKSEGYELKIEKAEELLHKSDGLFYRPSMQIDVDKTQMLEIEVILGNPLRIAERNKVDAPCLNMIYNMLKLIQFRIKEEQGQFKINEKDFAGVKAEDASDTFNRLYSN